MLLAVYPGAVSKVARGSAAMQVCGVARPRRTGLPARGAPRRLGRHNGASTLASRPQIIPGRVAAGGAGACGNDLPGSPSVRPQSGPASPPRQGDRRTRGSTRYPGPIPQLGWGRRSRRLPAARRGVGRWNRRPARVPARRGAALRFAQRRPRPVPRAASASDAWREPYLARPGLTDRPREHPGGPGRSPARALAAAP